MISYDIEHICTEYTCDAHFSYLLMRGWLAVESDKAAQAFFQQARLHSELLRYCKVPTQFTQRCHSFLHAHMVLTSNEVEIET